MDAEIGAVFLRSTVFNPDRLAGAALFDDVGAFSSSGRSSRSRMPAIFEKLITYGTTFLLVIVRTPGTVFKEFGSEIATFKIPAFSSKGTIRFCSIKVSGISFSASP